MSRAGPLVPFCGDLPAIAEYIPARHSDVEMVSIRGLALAVRVWGKMDAPRIVMLHGGRDSSITFQFLVDELAGEWQVIAPDWRGHGESAWAPENYWFQDYIADLDALLEHYSPDQPVPLIGHSLGGNVANVYSGVRPHRISRLVSLDGFGIPPDDPSSAPERICTWLDAVRSVRSSRSYPDLFAVVERLERAHPRLNQAKLAFLARHWVVANEDEGFRWRFDPKHWISFPTVHHFADWAACFARVTAPVLWLASDNTYSTEFITDRLRHFPIARYDRLADTGHNLHHDAPAAVARMIESFLS